MSKEAEKFKETKTQVLSVALGGGLDKANKVEELTLWCAEKPFDGEGPTYRTINVQEDHIAGFENKKPSKK